PYSHLSYLQTRPPPISTLFPYTTLFRSHGRQNIGDLLMEVVQLSLLLQSGQRQHRVGISLVPVEAALRDGIEERKKSIKILLLDRIVLVIVTAGATHGESQPGRCRRARAVHH